MTVRVTLTRKLHLCDAKIIDKHGDNLARCITVPGDGFRRRHDAFQWALAHCIKWSSMEIITEVFGIFSAHIDPAATSDLPHRNRQGLAPDFAVVFHNGGPRQLSELKFIGHTKEHFPTDKPARVMKDNEDVKLRASKPLRST